MDIKELEGTLFLSSSALIGILALIRFLLIEILDMLVGILEQLEGLVKRWNVFKGVPPRV